MNIFKKLMYKWGWMKEKFEINSDFDIKAPENLNEIIGKYGWGTHTEEKLNWRDIVKARLQARKEVGVYPVVMDTSLDTLEAEAISFIDNQKAINKRAEEILDELYKSRNKS